MADIIRFLTNIPQRFALVDPEGEPSPSNFGADEYKHRTCDGRLVYLDASVQAQLNLLEIQPGEEIEIVRSEVRTPKGKVKEWKVRSVTEGLTPPAPKAPPAAPAPPKPPATAISGTTRNVPDAAKPRINQSAAAEVMSKCLCAAIDAAKLAQAYGGEQGLELHFNEEDIRGLGISLFIQSFREAEIRARYGAERVA